MPLSTQLIENLTIKKTVVESAKYQASRRLDRIIKKKILQKIPGTRFQRHLWSPIVNFNHLRIHLNIQRKFHPNRSKRLEGISFLEFSRK